MLKIAVAYDRLRVIGKDQTLPWRLPEDLKLFKDRTMGHAVVMGRVTWESLRSPNPALKSLYALPGRINYVITSTPDKYEDVREHLPPNTLLFFMTYDQMLKVVKASKGIARQFGTPELPADYWIIGGEKIYEQFLKEGVVETVVASEVEGKHPGDAFFPPLSPDEYHPASRRTYSGFKVIEYQRKTPVIW
jgi:dihydrofolate reductase